MSDNLNYMEKDISDVMTKLKVSEVLLLKQFKDKSCIWWRISCNPDILSKIGINTLDAPYENIYDLDTLEIINWDILYDETIKEVSKEFIDKLPALDKLLCGGVKNAFRF